MEAGRGARGKVLSRWHAAAELGMADMRFFKDTAPSSRLSVPLSLEGCESYFVRETRAWSLGRWCGRAAERANKLR